MATNFVNEGDVITWTNGTGGDITSGTIVVVGNRLGVALVDIADTASGSVRMKGRVTAPKVSAAVIAQGEMVIWDVSAGAFDDNAATPATGDVSNAATAAEAAGSGVTSIDVIFTNQVGTVT